LGVRRVARGKRKLRRGTGSRGGENCECWGGYRGRGDGGKVALGELVILNCVDSGKRKIGAGSCRNGGGKKKKSVAIIYGEQLPRHVHVIGERQIKGTKIFGGNPVLLSRKGKKRGRWGKLGGIWE